MEKTCIEQNEVVIENQYIKLVISERGGRVFSFYDKIRNLECAKTYADQMHGINEVRLKGLFNEPEHLDPMNEGIHNLSVTEVGTTTIVKAEIETYVNSVSGRLDVKFIKEYHLDEYSSNVMVTFKVINQGSNEFHLAPWLSQMLNGSSNAFPLVSFMTEKGCYQSNNPIPGRHGLFWNNLGKTLSYFAVDNWICSTLTATDKANTFAVTSDTPFFKLASWRKPEEHFTTLETIFVPKTVQAGASETYTYYLSLTPAIENIVYCSNLLNIGTEQHVTGISAKSKNIVLIIAGTTPLSNLVIHGKLLHIPTKSIIKDYKFNVSEITPRTLFEKKLSVDLSEAGDYRLIIKIEQNGNIIKKDIVIPIVPEKIESDGIVFPSKLKSKNVFQPIPAKTVEVPLLIDEKDFTIYNYPVTERCFKNYKLVSTGISEIKLKSLSGTSETCSFVIVANKENIQSLTIKSLQLKGSNGDFIPAGAVRSVLYASTQIPSLYNPKYYVGDYPEALIPCSKIQLEDTNPNPIYITYQIPQGTAQGKYSGTIDICYNNSTYQVPVKLEVWAIDLPHVAPIALSCDIKSIPENIIIQGIGGKRLTVEQITQEVINMYLQYKLTPPQLAVKNLFLEKWNEFDEEMNHYIDAGANSIWMGTISKLMEVHGEDKIKRISEYLKIKKWDKYFYVRTGFDELSTDCIPQLLALIQKWKELSDIPVMETYYHQEDSRLFNNLDIYSREFSKEKWIQKRIDVGDQFWHVNSIRPLEEEPWKGRLLFWKFFDFRYTGSYIWTVKNWGSINDWGKDWWSDSGAENLCATLIWHHKTGLLATIRLEALKDGITDFMLFSLLRERISILKKHSHFKNNQKLHEAIDFFEGTPIWQRPQSGQELENIRNEAGNLLVQLNMLSV